MSHVLHARSLRDYDLVVRGRRVVLPEGPRPAAVAVRNGLIARVEPYGTRLAAREIVDAGELVVLPGLIDSHVHVDDPGRSDWEGWETATRAAAAGGITTLVDMPLNSVPPTTTLAGLEAKLRAAERRSWVDFGLWGGAVPENISELASLLDAGILGFKAFMAPSGVDEFGPLEEEGLRSVLEFLAASGDAPLLVHAEDPEALAPAALAREPTSYQAWLASRPPEAEARAIETLLRLVRETGSRAHVVHVSAAESIRAITRARREGLRVSAETCPHYLFFAAEEIPRTDLSFKCAPPIRERRHRESLWEALRDNQLDQVVSDHSPCHPSLRRGDYSTAWGGIASIQLSMSITWTGARERGFAPVDLARWMSAAPARLAGIADRKGAIATGLDADLVLWDPDAEVEVRREKIHHRHPQTPYVGTRLKGRVHTSFVRGQRIYEAGTFTGRPLGRWMRRAENA